ncbi:MAG: thymidylate synthase [Candidatus Woesearchaeota archaeon]
MNYEELLQTTRQQPGYADRKQRVCHELRNATITFTNNYEKPLQAVRSIGWHYPTNQELTSILLATDDLHQYTYAKHVHKQLPGLLEELTNNKHTRRAILYLTDYESSKQEIHQPCLLSLWAAIREDKLHITVHARSMDLLLGLPANLYQISVLAQTIAEHTRKELASITFSIASAHLFNDYEEELQTVIQTLKNP